MPRLQTPEGGKFVWASLGITAVPIYPTVHETAPSGTTKQWLDMIGGLRNRGAG